MKHKINKRRYKLREFQYETSKSEWAITSHNEYLLKFLDTGNLGHHSITTEKSIEEQLDNMSEVEELAYEDNINRTWFKFKAKK